MRIGVVFPQTEIGADVGAVRAYGERVEELGFAHILAYDHVVGADPAVHPGWRGPYDLDDHASTSRSCCSATSPRSPSLELVTGIIILPQRQTALVAKQAAEVDLLTERPLPPRRRPRLERRRVRGARQGLHDRGRRMGEQIELLRRLWTEPSVTFDGALRARDRRRASRRCRCSARSRSGSARCRRRPTAASGRLGRRLVPAGAARARSSTRRAPSWSAAAARGRPRPGGDRHGGSRQLGRRRCRQARRAGRALARRRAPPTSRSTRWAPGSSGSTRTWPRSRRSRRRSGSAPHRCASLPVPWTSSFPRKSARSRRRSRRSCASTRRPT